VDVVYGAARFVVVPVRLIAYTPATWLPLACLFTSVALAWIVARSGEQSASHRAVRAVTFFAGGLVLAWFVQFGRLSWSGSQDWAKDLTYYSALQQAMQQGVPPYYMRASFQHTDRYIANLETLAMPHAIVLRWSDINTFFVIHLIGTYAIGFVGLIGLGRELALSTFAWAVFVIVFLLNGHIVAHLSVGHTQWVGYFLVPHVLLAAVRVAKGHTDGANLVRIAVTLAALIGFGAWHLFMACLLLLIAACSIGWRSMRFIVVGASLAAAFAAYRIVPAITTYGAAENEFLGGYSSIGLLIAGLAGEPRTVSNGLGWHEYDLYVGTAGVALLALGLVPARSSALRFSNTLLLASAVVAFFSMYNIYERTLFQLPGFVSQRVSTRMAIIPVLVVALVGVAKLDAWIAPRVVERGPWRLGMLAFATFLIIEIVIRAAGWRPVAATTPLVASDALKVQAFDADYQWALIVGFAVSTLTVVGVGTYCWRRWREQRYEANA
jgi:hypothetical protein